MKQIILYYSHGGNNEQLAQFISKRYRKESVAIKEKRKKRTMFTIMLDLLFRRKPSIEPLSVSLENYDQVIIIAPLWIGRIASPMLSALKKYGGQIDSYQFITFSGNPRECEEQVLSSMEKLLNKRAVHHLGFAIEDLLTDEQKKDSNNLMKFKLNETRMSALTPVLDKHFW